MIFPTRIKVVDHTYTQPDWNEWQALAIKRYLLCVLTTLATK